MKVKAFLSLAAAVCAMSLQAGFKAGFARLDAIKAATGLPCEPFVNIGRRIKNNSPFGATVITCLTNGNRGYLAEEFFAATIKVTEAYK